MNVFRLDRISHSTLKNLDRSRTAVLVTMSPMEVHGPHLPLGQDWFEAQAILEKTADKMAKERTDWNFVILPPLPIAIDCVPAQGSISYPVQLVRDVAFHTMEPFAKHGFARLAFSSFHGGPRHICALEDACSRLEEKYDAAAVSLFSAVLARIDEDVFFKPIEKLKSRKITKEQMVLDRHAGMVETSLALHLWPELVDDGWQDLPGSTSEEPVTRGKPRSSFLFDEKGGQGLLDKADKVLGTVKSMYRAMKHFNEHTYFGFPAFSSEKQGELMLKHMIEVCGYIMGEFLDEGRDFDGHSPLWRLKDVLLNRQVNHIAQDWLHLYSE